MNKLTICKNFIELHKKTYHKISWDYLFKSVLKLQKNIQEGVKIKFQDFLIFSHWFLNIHLYSLWFQTATVFLNSACTKRKLENYFFGFFKIFSITKKIGSGAV
jgi:hypothetical protein